MLPNLSEDSKHCSLITHLHCKIDNICKTKNLLLKGGFLLKMPKAGLEPARGCPHKILSLARLPISSLRHGIFSFQILTQHIECESIITRTKFEINTFFKIKPHICEVRSLNVKECMIIDSFRSNMFLVDL